MSLGEQERRDGLQGVAERVLTKLRVQPSPSEMGKLRS